MEANKDTLPEEVARKKIKIKFDGNLVSDGELAVGVLAPALMSFEALMSEANSIVNGREYNVALKVSANIKRGSFEIELNSGLLEGLVGFFSSAPITALLNVFALLGIGRKGVGAISIIKDKLKGRTVESIEEEQDGFLLKVDGEEIKISREEYRFLESKRARDALHAIFYETLNTNGIDEVKISDEEGESVEIKKEEAHFFISRAITEEMLSVREYEKDVNCIQVPFVDSLIWKFSDGVTSFNARMNDQEFISKVSSGEITFSAKDTFRIKVKEEQIQTRDGFTTKFSVIKVIGHLRQTIIGD